jgi:protein TonB
MRIRQFLTMVGFLGLLALAYAQTDPAAKPRLRVSSGVAQGLKTHDVTPKYPAEAREKGIYGDVVLQATIDTKGEITNIKLVEGEPILAAAAIKAVQQWKYRPYILKGEPVEVQTTIKIQFHLR